MVYIRIRRNSYFDSINLTLLTNAVNTTVGVKSAQVMMGTSANKELFKAAGLYNEEVENAAPNDIVVAVDADDERVMDKVMQEVEDFLRGSSVSEVTRTTKKATTWDEALRLLPDANMALISIPGNYAAREIEYALDNELHTFVISEKVPIEEEVRLKKKAHEKGLLLMGPDSKTGILSSVPLGFSNVVKPGNIGIVGAESRGIQEVMTIIDHLGGGVIHAIGTGSRDLSKEVGAITMIDGLTAIHEQEEVDVIVLISKSPKSEVREKVVEQLHGFTKSIVVIFVGERPAAHENNVYFAYTLDEAAKIAVDLASGNEVKESYQEPLAYSGETKVGEAKKLPTPHAKTLELLAGKPRVINIGIKSFGDTVKAFGGEVVQFDWESKANRNNNRKLDEMEEE